MNHMNCRSARVGSYSQISLMAGAVAPLLMMGSADAQVTVLETRKLLSADGAAFDLFGADVDIDAGIAIVGAPLNEVAGLSGNDHGAAYLFDASTGAQLRKLIPDLITPQSLRPGDRLGSSVAIDGGIAASGSPSTGNPSRGTVFLFDTLSGAEQFKLTAAGSTLQQFGNSVGLDNDLVVIGSLTDQDNGIDSGAAYRYDAATGLQIDKFSGSDTGGFDLFGFEVTVDDGLYLVGAPTIGITIDPGAAYLFDAATGAELHRLAASGGVSSDLFGRGGAIGDGRAFVGAPGDDESGPLSGSVYAYTASTGSEQRRFNGNDTTTGDFFGASVAAASNLVIAGAPFDDDSGIDSGSVYVFSAGTGTQLAKLLPSDGVAGAKFGQNVAFDGNWLVVGAHGALDASGVKTGAAYVFDFTPCSVADIGFPRGVINLNDLDAFVAAYLADDVLADCNGDNSVNGDDLDCFTDAFLAGCP